MKKNTIDKYLSDQQGVFTSVNKFRSPNELGIVCSFPQEPTDSSFYFWIHPDVDIKSGEYVEVAAGKYVIIGVISRIFVYDYLYRDINFLQSQSHSASLMDFQALLPPGITRYRIAQVNIVSVLENGKLTYPSIPPEPGERVYLIREDLLKKVLGLPNSGIYIGTLIDRPDVKVYLDPEKLLHLHFAIFGSTGTGKSYTAGVIIEEFLEKGFPVLVIDPHGEYKKMQYPNTYPDEIRRLKEFGLNPRGYNVKIYEPYFQNKGDLSINFQMLDFDALSELARVSETMRDLLFLAVKELKKNNEQINFSTLSNKIDTIAQKWRFSFRTRVALRRNIEVLEELGIFGEGFDVSALIKPGQLTVISLNDDMPEYITKIFVGILLNEIFKARKNKKIPKILIVIDECHRFISVEDQEKSTFTLNVIRKIAREGRKFGIGLGVVSQRIVGLDKTVISQCRTKFILRLDMYTDIDQLIQYFGDEKVRQKIISLPEGAAYIVGTATRFPILVKIRPRKSSYVRLF